MHMHVRAVDMIRMAIKIAARYILSSLESMIQMS